MIISFSKKGDFKNQNVNMAKKITGSCFLKIKQHCFCLSDFYHVVNSDLGGVLELTFKDFIVITVIILFVPSFPSTF